MGWSVDLESQKDDPRKWRSVGMKYVSLTSSNPTPTFDENGLFGMMAYFDQCNCLFVASITGDVRERRRPDGLIENHAYTVLEVQKACGQCVVKLRNPWGGDYEWNGKFSDKWRGWRDFPELKADLNLRVADDGSFWMPWKDFQQVFSTIKVCPGSLASPKISRIVGGWYIPGGIRCGHCQNTLSRLWIMNKSSPRGHGEWTRLEEGDLCFMCHQAHVGLITVRPGLQEVPGINSFLRLPRLTNPDPPRKDDMPICSFGPDCYRFNPDHFAKYLHPWLRLNFSGRGYHFSPRPLRRSSTESADVPSMPSAPATPSIPAVDPTSPVRPSTPVLDPTPSRRPSSIDMPRIHKMLNLAKNDDWPAVMSMLEKTPELVNIRPPNRNWATIHRAAAMNATQVVRDLVTKYDANHCLLTGDGMTPHKVAMVGGCLETALYLISLSVKKRCAEIYSDGCEVPSFEIHDDESEVKESGTSPRLDVELVDHPDV